MLGQFFLLWKLYDMHNIKEYQEFLFLNVLNYISIVIVSIINTVLDINCGKLVSEMAVPFSRFIFDRLETLRSSQKCTMVTNNKIYSI